MYMFNTDEAVLFKHLKIVTLLVVNVIIVSLVYLYLYYFLFHT